MQSRRIVHECHLAACLFENIYIINTYRMTGISAIKNMHQQTMYRNIGSSYYCGNVY